MGSIQPKYANLLRCFDPVITVQAVAIFEVRAVNRAGMDYVRP
jgi:hypothetical protein